MGKHENEDQAWTTTKTDCMILFYIFVIIAQLQLLSIIIQFTQITYTTNTTAAFNSRNSRRPNVQEDQQFESHKQGF